MACRSDRASQPPSPRHRSSSHLKPEDTPFPIPQSPSRSPIRRWRDSLGQGLCTCLARRSGSVEEPTEEEFPYIRNHPRQRPTTFVRPTLPGKRVREYSFAQAPQYTHLAACLINDTQCFLVSTRKIWQHNRLKPKLGICVEFSGVECRNTDCVRCRDCGVCPHLYSCSCPLKFMGTKWCAHIHTMHTLTKGNYLQAAMLFIHDDWKQTEMRHVRAFIQGPTKMKKVRSGLYEEQFEHLMRTMIYRVQIMPAATTSACSCEPDKKCELCEACLCRYACTCPDYHKDRQVCQHIHSVAMQEHKDASTLFGELVEFGRKYTHALQDLSDPNHRYYMEQEHEMSLYSDVSRITKVPGEPPHPESWLIEPAPSDADNKVITVKRVAETSLCYCSAAKATKANTCVRCQICAHHYSCSCSRSQFIVCRHMHAVARLESNDEELTEDTIKYIDNIVESAEADYGTKTYLYRSPVGPVAGELDSLK